MSVFSELPQSAWVASNARAFAIRAPSPATIGHTLVILRRPEVHDWFAATEEERRAIFELVDVVKVELDRSMPRPDGYNVGFDVGEAAGQTERCLCVHLIPRFRGDTAEARGVRHVAPARTDDLGARRTEAERALEKIARASPLATGGEHDPLARQVLPLFALADDIAIVAAFVQESGLDRVEPVLTPALDRGATVRILTGDYLEITQVSALERLLDLQRSAELEEDDEASLSPQPGRLEVRVVEVDRLPGRTRSFHPKSWRFEAETFGLAFVGSSNLSRAALDTGVEWNLRVDRDRDHVAYEKIREAFEARWAAATPLDDAFIRAYAARARTRPPHLAPSGEVEPEELPTLPPPHEVQREALAKLRQARDDGRRRALVVLATGLGKTLLAAFDYRQLCEEQGGRPRVLFLAHRREILRQAAASYRRLLRDLDPGATIGWFSETEGDLSATLVFGSVAKLARKPHLDRLRSERFDYVVVDEVHHAAAESYRRILAAVDPGFLLGLTATPDRADAADILGLFDDFVAYRADITRGVEVGRLVPFHYFGVKDDIDYANIPWRNRRFEPEALTRAAETEARMRTLWGAWAAHPGTRTLVFCCSVTHAAYVRDWLAGQGLRVAAVFSAEGSDDRDESMLRLKAGELDALCAVDVFNEGVDVPEIDRVVMLRPTESSVVFLQQLGRGLRAKDGKEAVTVIDFVGNHRIFLERLRTLLALAPAAENVTVQSYLKAGPAVDLPQGCRVELELEAKALLQSLFRVGGADEVERAYRELRLERGERPKAGEMHRLRYLPSRIQERHGSWFDFVKSERDLTADELHVFEAVGGFLRDLEKTSHASNIRAIVTLAVMLEADALSNGMEGEALARAAHEYLLRSPELAEELTEAPEFREAITDDAAGEWTRRWTEDLLAARGRSKRTWFALQSHRLELRIPTVGLQAEALDRLVAEVVDYRLAVYRERRQKASPTTGTFVCKVISNAQGPIITDLPAELPRGVRAVQVGRALWEFHFAKIACNVARPVGVSGNHLHGLLRGWFGANAGRSGTNYRVRFVAAPDGLHVEPVDASLVDLRERRTFTTYPNLRAAAGHTNTEHAPVEGERVLLRTRRDYPDDGVFAVRVAGRSMDGGPSPLRDGDWAILRVLENEQAVRGDRILVELPGQSTEGRYQLKRLEREGDTWRLRSDNPDEPDPDATEMRVIAKLEEAIHPEDLAPPLGSMFGADGLAEGFGLEDLPPKTGRFGGHLFLFLEEKGALETPERVHFPTERPRPGETAYVLAKRDGGWRFLGVGRRITEVENRWSIPEVDYETWRALGDGREVSRRLPDGYLERARGIVEVLLASSEPPRSMVHPANGRTARLVGRAEEGGLRIDGGHAPGAFKPRTVSLIDVAWVLVAADDVAGHGGLLDEARVNRLRYLSGTPRGSTRYIDNAWALAAVRAAQGG